MTAEKTAAPLPAPADHAREQEPVTIVTAQGERITFAPIGDRGYWRATQEGMPDEWWLSRVASRAVDEIVNLRWEIANSAEHQRSEIAALQSQVAEARADAERERLRLAACGVAARGGTTEGMDRAYDSDSLQAVLSLVAKDSEQLALAACMNAISTTIATLDEYAKEGVSLEEQEIDYAGISRAALSAALAGGRAHE